MAKFHFNHSKQRKQLSFTQKLIGKCQISKCPPPFRRPCLRTCKRYVVRISAGSCQDLKYWILLQSGQALGIMTVAGKFSNADAIFVGVRSCCLLPSHRNNLVEDQVCAVDKRAISSTSWTNLCPGYRRCHWKDNSCVVHCLYSKLRGIRTFRKMFSCLRRSDRRDSDGMGHVWLTYAIDNVDPTVSQRI